MAETLLRHKRWAWAGRLAQMPGLRHIGWLAYEVAAFALFRWKGNF